MALRDAPWLLLYVVAVLAGLTIWGIASWSEKHLPPADEQVEYASVECHIVNRSIYELPRRYCDYTCRRITYNCSALALERQDPIQTDSSCCCRRCANYAIAQVEALFPIGQIRTGYVYDTDGNQVDAFHWSVPDTILDHSRTQRIIEIGVVITVVLIACITAVICFAYTEQECCCSLNFIV